MRSIYDALPVAAPFKAIGRAACQIKFAILRIRFKIFTILEDTQIKSYRKVMQGITAARIGDFCAFFGAPLGI